MYRDKYHKYHTYTYYIAEVLQKINDKISELNNIPWRHKADWKMPPRSSRPLVLGGSSSTTCSSPVRGCEIARVSSHTFIAQQVVGNNVHELNKDGSSYEV